MQAHFGDVNAPMRQLNSPAALGPYRLLDDGEIASENALALSLLASLDRPLGHEPPRATALAAALAGHATVQPLERAGLLLALAGQIGASSATLRTTPHGAVQIRPTRPPIG